MIAEKICVLIFGSKLQFNFNSFIKQGAQREVKIISILKGGWQEASIIIYPKENLPRSGTDQCKQVIWEIGDWQTKSTFNKVEEIRCKYMHTKLDLQPRIFILLLQI